MRRLLFILVVFFFFLYTAVATSFAAIEPGEVIKKLLADLDGDGGLEVIAIRQCTPPAGFERVEIFEDEETNKPAFASHWKELEDGLLLSSKGDLKLERVGSRVLAKYIWRRRGMGTGGGHESERITYYGYVNGRFGPVLEYTAKNLDWSKGRFGNSPYSREKISTLCFEDIDGDKEPEIYISIREKTEEPEKIGEEFSPLRTNTVQRLLRYTWKESKGFVLTEEKKIGE